MVFTPCRLAGHQQRGLGRQSGVYGHRARAALVENGHFRAESAWSLGFEFKERHVADCHIVAEHYVFKTRAFQHRSLSPAERSDGNRACEINIMDGVKRGGSADFHIFPAVGPAALLFEAIAFLPFKMTAYATG